MSVHQTPDGRYYVHFRLPGSIRRGKEYFGRGSEAKKQAEARDYEIKAQKKRCQVVRSSSSMYLDELAQLYLDDAKARGRSERWRSEWAHMLNSRVLPAMTGKPVDHLRYQDILGLIAKAWPDGSAATINRYMGYLKALFRFGVDHEFTTRNPLAKWTDADEGRRDMRLTVEDLQRIYDHAEPHLKWAIEVQWALATRPGVTELLTIRWADVDFEARTVHVRGTKTRGADRLVPIDPDFAERLAAMRCQARTEYLIEYQGRPIKKIRRALKTAARHAGITYDVRMYDLRHLCASAMLAGGADLQAVSKILGHSSTKMTADTYYHLMAGEKEKAVRARPKVGPKDRGKVVFLGYNLGDK